MTESFLDMNLSEKSHLELETLLDDVPANQIREFLIDRGNKILKNFGTPIDYKNNSKVAGTARLINGYIDEILNIREIILSGDGSEIIEDLYSLTNLDEKIEEENFDESKAYCTFWALFADRTDLWYYGDDYGTLPAFYSAAVFGPYTLLKRKVRDIITILETGDIPDIWGQYDKYLDLANGRAKKQSSPSGPGMHG